MGKGPDCGAPIAKVRVPAGRRAADPEKVKALAESIREIGLLSPIIVDWHSNEDRHGDESCELVAGLHRLEACRSLGWKRIPTVDRNSVPSHEERGEAPDPERGRLLNRLAEIDENLCRLELSVVDRSKAIADRKAIYEELHPETRDGVRGGHVKAEKAHSATATVTVAPSFVDDTAAKTGRPERTIRREAQIGEALTAETVEAVRGTPIENSTRALVEIAREKDPQKQVERAKQKVEATAKPKEPRADAGKPPKPEAPTKRQPDQSPVNGILDAIAALDETRRMSLLTVLVDRYPIIKFSR